MAAGLLVVELADEVTAATFLEAWQSADLHTAPGTDVAAAAKRLRTGRQRAAPSTLTNSLRSSAVSWSRAIT